MKLRHIHLNVSDIDVVSDWYRAHLGFTTMHEVPGHLYILEHSDGECLIGFERGAPLEPASSVHLILRVGDVDALHGELSANGVEIDFPPTDQPYGHRVMAVFDPAGHTVELYTPLDGERPWD